jgi:hypothetical protein
MNWTYIVLIICCLAAVFAVWKECGRAEKAHLILRIIASLLAIMALGCIALPVNYSKDITRQDDNNAILLTAGFEPDSLTNYKGGKLFTTDKTIERKYPKAKLIRLEELKNDSPAVTKMHVFGYGLTETELNQLDNLPVVFHPASVPEGITATSWNQKLKAGETLRVQGRYKNDGLKPVKLVLKGLNSGLDTATIPAKTYTDFELTAVPKNTGRAVYHLQATSGTDTLANENLPIQIEPIKPLKILILSTSPDFETKFLKNWLSENGFSVAVRSAISKDKFSSEYVNMQPLKIDHLNNGLLDKFDLVIGDLSVLTSESALLNWQVTQKGLGIIIRADSSSKAASWLQNDFPVEKINLKDLPSVFLFIKGKKGKLAGLKVDPAFLGFKPGTQPLAGDAQNHILVNSSLAGAGRLVATTVNNTWGWVLAGDKDDYSAFWALLISKAARKTPDNENWSVGSQLPVFNEPVQLQLESSSNPGQIRSDNSIVAPAQNPLMPFEWVNEYWPSAAGWHSIKQNNGQPAWWYAYGADEWPGVKAFKKIADTRKYASDNHIFNSVTKLIHQKLRIEAPKIYFYLLLLAACTFLWVEGKLAPPNHPR